MRPERFKSAWPTAIGAKDYSGQGRANGKAKAKPGKCGTAKRCQQRAEEGEGQAAPTGLAETVGEEVSCNSGADGSGQQKGPVACPMRPAHGQHDR